MLLEGHTASTYAENICRGCAPHLLGNALEMLTALFVINNEHFDFSTSMVNVYLLMCESHLVMSD